MPPGSPRYSGSREQGGSREQEEQGDSREQGGSRGRAGGEQGGSKIPCHPPDTGIQMVAGHPELLQ